MGRYVVWAVLVAVAGCGSSGSSVTNTTAAAQISIAGYAFSPSSVTIKVGSSVAWSNNDPVQHTSTADGGAWNSGQLSAPSSGGGAYGGGTAGGSYRYTFSSTGTFPYHCANHTYMTGTITVNP